MLSSLLKLLRRHHHYQSTTLTSGHSRRHPHRFFYFLATIRKRIFTTINSSFSLIFWVVLFFLSPFFIALSQKIYSYGGGIRQRTSFSAVWRLWLVLSPSAHLWLVLWRRVASDWSFPRMLVSDWSCGVVWRRPKAKRVARPEASLDTCAIRVEDGVN